MFSNITFKAGNKKIPKIFGKSKVPWRLIDRKAW